MILPLTSKIMIIILNLLLYFKTIWWDGNSWLAISLKPLSKWQVQNSNGFILTSLYYSIFSTSSLFSTSIFIFTSLLPFQLQRMTSGHFLLLTLCSEMLTSREPKSILCHIFKIRTCVLLFSLFSTHSLLYSINTCQVIHVF